MALAASQVNERKRVKVYELKDSDWWDRGTGFCAVQTILHEEALFVESEDNGRPLLQTKVEKDYNYQKQQETLIVWTDSDGLDMALSFQESEGCALVWNTINEVQLRQGSEGFQLSLPEVTLEHLTEIESLVKNALGSAQGRDPFIKHIEQENWLGRLVPLVKIAEEQESLADLHKLCNIFKTLILFNDNKFIEEVITDEMIMGVVGAMEYDPDFPEHKANHRSYLADKSRFKEVVTIADDKIRARIHGTFRLQYLKDVVLARILDDPTFSVLNSLIYYYQMDVLSHITSNPTLVKEIFSVVIAPSQPQQRKKDAILLIQQCTSIAKGAAVQPRGQLYASLVNNGLFPIIAFALQNQDAAVRVAGVDIFLTIIDHDPVNMRNLVLNSLNDKTKSMLETLVDLFLAEPDLGVKAQVADAIKILLEPSSTPAAATDRTSAGQDSAFAAKLRPNTQAQSKHEAHIVAFFDGPAAKKLFQPLKDLEKRDSLFTLTVYEISLFVHLIEILSFFLRTQFYKSKLFILESGLATFVARLVAAPQKHLKLIAIKYFKAVIAINDEHHNRQLIRDNLFEPILNILTETLPRDNLLNSACFELFEIIRKEQLKPFIIHLVETYRERLDSIQIRGINTFEGLVLRYDQLMDPTFVPTLEGGAGDSSFMTTDAETPNTKHVTIPGGGQRWQGLKDPDLEEDAYFNTSDDEEDDEDELSKDVPSKELSKGYYGKKNTRTHISLVPYGDDDDDDEDDLPRRVDENDRLVNVETGDVVVTPKKPPIHVPESSPITATDHDSPSSASLLTMVAAPSTPATSNAPSSTPPHPLPSLAEKRRREEDDEDELGKLASSAKPSKRRNSSGKKLTSFLAQNQNQSVSTSTYTKGEPDDVAAADVESEKVKVKEKEKPAAGSAVRRTPSLKRKKGFIMDRTRSVRSLRGSGNGDAAAAAGSSDGGSEKKKGKSYVDAGDEMDGE